MNIGIGYNPILLNDIDLIPPFINFVECGPDDISLFSGLKLENNLSVHIARPAICEDTQNQDLYLASLHERLTGQKYVSIGLHVIGPRLHGIGQFGFSSHYDANFENEEKIIRFVKKAQDLFGKPIWLENVNFYSKSKYQVFKTHESINRIVEQCDAKIIADLTHLYVDAHNVGIDETALLGAINWDAVVELHLAGTITSSNGVKHDGHSQPVPLSVWQLYEKIVDYRLIDFSTIVTIEHTDPDWINALDDFNNDYVKAAEIHRKLKDQEHFPFQLRPMEFALGYIKRKVRQRISNIDQVLDAYDLTLDDMLEEWVLQLLTKNKNLVINKNEVQLFWQGENVEFYGESFVEFCNQRMTK